MIPSPERVSQSASYWYVWFAEPCAQIQAHRGIVAQREMRVRVILK